jgi:hypothetical protein
MVFSSKVSAEGRMAAILPNAFVQGKQNRVQVITLGDYGSR